MPGDCDGAGGGPGGCLPEAVLVAVIVLGLLSWFAHRDVVGPVSKPSPTLQHLGERGTDPRSR